MLEAIEAGLGQVVHDFNVVSGAIKDPANRRALKEGAASCLPSLMDTEGMDALIGLMVKHDVYYSPTFVTRYKMFSRRAKEQEQANLVLFARNDLQYAPRDALEGILSSYHRLRNELRSGKVPEPGFTWLDEFTPAELEGYKSCYAKSQEFLRRFVAAGGHVNTGTDMPSTSVPGAGLLHEMEMEAESGMTPMQVLQATTINTAKFFRQDKMLGTVEAGKLADLVVLGGDPLADISNAQKTEMVIKNGQVLDRGFQKEFDPIIKRPMDRITYLMPPLFRPSTFFRTGLIQTLRPALATEGSPDLEIVVDGLGFSGSSVVRIANNKLKTTYMGPERLRARIPARLLQVAGTYPITVESPPPGGGISNAYGFIVKFK